MRTLVRQGGAKPRALSVLFNQDTHDIDYAVIARCDFSTNSTIGARIRVGWQYISWTVRSKGAGDNTCTWQRKLINNTCLDGRMSRPAGEPARPRHPGSKNTCVAFTCASKAVLLAQGNACTAACHHGPCPYPHYITHSISSSPYQPPGHTP